MNATELWAMAELHLTKMALGCVIAHYFKKGSNDDDTTTTTINNKDKVGQQRSSKIP
jgi:hypothetical protein